ncbi:hypothetical protein [Frigidibacter sp. SD6-1]|uniref:hypothetical protein n=1 Tax=Frigidibacter sp. SD6-1 TaxID=3032581 RepID=UPI0024DFB634|nr:hypothetical protein [Frigidibacter sp. SD6-1]
MRFTLIAGLFALILPSAALAGGTIDKACRATGRAGAGLCGCIQSVADQVLSRSDQRRAATFFADPDKAQEVRLSDSASAEAFWDRYAAFASTAEAVCTGG